MFKGLRQCSCFRVEAETSGAGVSPEVRVIRSVLGQQHWHCAHVALTRKTKRDCSLIDLQLDAVQHAIRSISRRYQAGHTQKVARSSRRMSPSDWVVTVVAVAVPWHTNFLALRPHSVSDKQIIFVTGNHRHRVPSGSVDGPAHSEHSVALH